MCQLVIFDREYPELENPVWEAKRHHRGDVIFVCDDDFEFGNMEPGEHTLLVQIPGIAKASFEHLQLSELGPNPDDCQFAPRNRAWSLIDMDKRETRLSKVKAFKRYNRITNKNENHWAPQLAHVIRIQPHEVVQWLGANMIPKKLYPNPNYKGTKEPLV